MSNTATCPPTLKFRGRPGLRLACAAGALLVYAATDAATAAPYYYGYERPYPYVRSDRFDFYDDMPRRSFRRPYRQTFETPDAKLPKTSTEPSKQAQAQRLKGPMLIVVSVARQRLTVFDDGKPVAEAPISTGMKGHLTPTGVFSVIQKQKFHRSNIYSGAPMPFMQRITWSGIALHAGVLPGYPASHGCIRMPNDFAVRLFGMTRMGARVIIARGDVTPVEIAHAKLFVLKKPEPQKAPETEKNPDVPTSDLSPQVKPQVKPDVTAAKDAVAPETSLLVKTASAGASVTDAVRPVADAAPERALRPGPVSVFVSRKESKVFVRKGFEPVFDMPVTISQPEKPLGTHVFTAADFKDDGVTARWIVASVSDAQPAPAMNPVAKDGRRLAIDTPFGAAPQTSAANALDRIVIPQAALDRIATMMTPGASLIISDQGLGSETGKETDFVVLTR